MGFLYIQKLGNVMYEIFRPSMIRFNKLHYLLKGRPLPGPERGLCLTLRNELSEETHAEKARLHWEVALRWRDDNTGAQDCSPCDSQPLGLEWCRLLSGLSLTTHLASAHIWSDSGSFLVQNVSLSQDGFQCEGFWEVGRTHYRRASPPSFWVLCISPG